MRILKNIAASVLLIAQLASAGNAMAQSTPATVFEPTSNAGGNAGSGWSYDPARDGMRDLFEMKPIDGCNAPGGLVLIHAKDEPDSAPYWCGTPPHCLQMTTKYSDRCNFQQYCRREPRGNPSGIPGANGCREPQDLVCGHGGMPEGGQCLKQCWDSSKVLLSEKCPPKPRTECSTDSDGNTSCWVEWDIDPTPYEPPPPPPPPPPPAFATCAAQTYTYGACTFALPATLHEQTTGIVQSNNGIPGTMSATCFDGSLTAINATCNTNTGTPTTPTTPTIPTVPAPTLDPCPGGSGPYGACYFTWGNAQSGQTLSVASSNGVNGTVTGTCYDGSWTNIVVNCTPAAIAPICPDGTPAPANGICPVVPTGPAPSFQNCSPATFTEGTCVFNFDSAGHNAAVSVPAASGGTGTMSALCADGEWIDRVATCTPAYNCADGTAAPSGGCMKTCNDAYGGTFQVPESQSCPVVETACPGGATVPLNKMCGGITGNSCYHINVVTGELVGPNPYLIGNLKTNPYYAYCTKKPEYAAKYQNCFPDSLDPGYNLTYCVSFPPAAYGAEAAYPMLSKYVYDDCGTGRTLDEHLAMYPYFAGRVTLDAYNAEVDVINQRTRQEYCID